MTITSISPESIGIDLTFSKPFKSASKTSFDFAVNGTQTTVHWQVRTPKTFMLRVMSVFMKLTRRSDPI